jgi:DNA repair exonuclease SbcCD nuclease subunit
MLSFVFRTDTHLTDRSPASWKADYTAEIWSNIVHVGRIAKEYEASAVLDGGDYFHVKAASRNPHFIVAETARIHALYPCRTFSVEGNHDIMYNHLDTVERQPIGVLYASGVFGKLRNEVFRDGNLQVRVVGVPYSATRTEEELRSIQKQPGDSFLIAIVHNLAAQDPPDKVQDFFNEPVFRYDRLITRNGPDVWCFGHWHKDQGVVEIAGKSFVNHGALSRGALINENIHRTPTASVLRFENDEFQVIPVPMLVAPPEDVFDFERKERQEKESQDIDLFVQKLQADAAFDPSASIEENLRIMDFAHDVKAFALDYLERARAEVG